MTDIYKVIKDSTLRIEGWVRDYGILSEIRLSGLGLHIRAMEGAEAVEKIIDWCDLEASPDPDWLLRRAEQSILRGLST